MLVLISCLFPPFERFERYLDLMSKKLHSISLIALRHCVSMLSMLLLLAFLPSLVLAEPEEMWLINANRAHYQRAEPVEALDALDYLYSEAAEGSTWTLETSDATTFEEKVLSVQSIPTVVVIPGNRNPQSEVVKKLPFLISFFNKIYGEQKYRLITWVWPSAKIPGRPLLDYRVKLARVPRQAKLFAAWLEWFGPEANLLIVGHSYGAKVAADGVAIHTTSNAGTNGTPIVPIEIPLDIPLKTDVPSDTEVDGAEEVAAERMGTEGMSTEEVAMEEVTILPPRGPRSLKLALIAMADVRGAIRKTRFGDENSAVEKILLTKNTQDCSLKLFSLVSPNSAGAVGYGGISSADLPRMANVLDVTNQVHRSHDFGSYIKSSSLVKGIRKMVRDGDPAPVKKEVPAQSDSTLE